VIGQRGMERGASRAASGALALGRRDDFDLNPAGLATEIITTIEGIRALEPDYEHLYRATGNVLPFALQAWHLAWCRHFLNRNPLIRQEPLFCALRTSAGECVAIVPLIFTRRRVGPFRIAAAALLGGDPGLTELGNPLIKPGYERATVRAVHESLGTLPEWDWIQWRGVSPELAAALTAEARPVWYEASEDYILDLSASWEAFRAGLKRNVRESLRHCYNSLKRNGHAFEFVVAREPDQVRAALDRFLQLHALRAGMAWGAKHPNFFTSHSAREFLYDVCARLALRDAVRVFQLRIGDEIVASRVAFVVGDSVYLYYSGFDPAWARYSVMTTTLAEAFKYAIASGLKSVNLSLTREQSKVRWRPRVVKFHSALVHSAFLRSRIVCRAYRVAITHHGPSAQALRSFLRPRRDWN
jgi:CelD/BcsL family acetyltransferase involved in cellulose biosynthesis